jgi:hypothetical protein
MGLEHQVPWKMFESWSVPYFYLEVMLMSGCVAAVCCPGRMPRSAARTAFLTAQGVCSMCCYNAIYNSNHNATMP